MSQGSSSNYSSVEQLRGKSYPVCLQKHIVDGIVSAIFPQFSFGIGSGESEEEALDDAVYILAIGLEDMVEGREEIPPPLDLDAAKVLMLDLGLSDKGVEESWAQVQVKPECLAEGT
ncbi:hypothetical protein PLESTB_001863500 [Pleodorina starrii]|uniref:Uncharacterized protein n=1 Tax=Pleodorina starrii TaxID=330485 RepID=A0A9W6C118_9CHLO|nr:hypothetical protein PLESTM_000923800 [Pleodorina starrii]GLC62261.1 hypothetical protein PLESTB_001863500 [Pleodorina starrii]GLC77714.1 hypothetical protein PLESTF_001979300 [Pleodorina starrii]